MKKQDYAKRYLNKLALLMLAAPLILVTAGCDEIDSGEVQNSIELPVDSVLNFRCENEGIFPEDCVLDNPENPYVSVAVTEDNKFDLSEDAPSAKSRYYLWATALARGAGLQGENQFFTALSLQEVFAESGSPTTRDQARKAYRSVLDNFFLSPSFFKVTDILTDYELLENGGVGSPEATGGDVFCHTGWECENESYTTAADSTNSAPVSHNPEDNQSIKQFGDNGLSFQVVPAIQINDASEITYTATVWAMNWTGNGTTDPFTDLGYMELTVLDTGGGVLAAENVSVLPSVNLLNNGGFGSPEATGGDVFCHTGWACENNSYTTAADGPNSAPVSHNPEDNQSIKQFDDDGLTFQVVDATPGMIYQASVWAMNWTGNGTTDPFTESGFVELSFLDAAGDIVPGSQQYVYVDAVDDGVNVYLPPQDGAEVSDWTQLTISAVAPAGTVSARMLLIHQLVGGSGGTLRWDDASITAANDGENVYLPPQDGADVSDWRKLELTVVAPEGAASVKLLLQHQLAGGSGGSLRWDDASIVTEATISFALKDAVGLNLYDPESVGLVTLYPDPDPVLSQLLALSDISNWGYVYDPLLGIMSVFQP
jgi:hypothetical protein